MLELKDVHIACSSVTAYDHAFNNSNMIGATSEAGSAYASGSPS